MLPALSYFIGWCFNKIFPDIPFWVETISPLYAYIILYSIFEKYTWHWKVFKLFGIVQVADLRGRWEGTQRSSHEENGAKIENKVAIEIKQSFSKIIIQAFYERSSSESVIADFYTINDEEYLYYTYDNDPNSLKNGTMQRHRGTAKLHFNVDEKRLMGSYFNSIGNLGEIDVHFKQTKRLNRLNRN